MCNPRAPAEMWGLFYDISPKPYRHKSGKLKLLYFRFSMAIDKRFIFLYYFLYVIIFIAMGFIERLSFDMTATSIYVAIIYFGTGLFFLRFSFSHLSFFIFSVVHMNLIAFAFAGFLIPTFEMVKLFTGFASGEDHHIPIMFHLALALSFVICVFDKFAIDKDPEDEEEDQEA
jgi:hypothetical protein